MTGSKILLMDCNGESRPRITFLFEIAGYEICHAGGIVEAINRLLLSRETSERFCAFVINNPDLNHDLEFLGKVCFKEKVNVPVIIVSQKLENGALRKRNGIIFCHPAEVLQGISSVIED